MKDKKRKMGNLFGKIDYEKKLFKVKFAIFLRTSILQNIWKGLLLLIWSLLDAFVRVAVH